MSKRTLIYIIIVWCILTIVEYYFIPFYILAFLWVGLSLALFIIFLIELVKLIQECKSLSRLRISKVIVFFGLFFFTFRDTFVNELIEKVDWIIFYDRRMNIIQQVKNGELDPNVSWNNWICKLPYDFPVVSNGGNDIGIDRNQKVHTITVTFFIFRNYMEAPSTELIYTDNYEKMKELEKLTIDEPEQNWKINNNWYRTVDR